MKHNKGFTLIELMVVIAIIGVLAALAAPSFRTQIQRNQVSGQVREFTAHVQEARAKAVTLRRNYPFTINGGTSGGAQTMTDDAATWTPNSDRVVVVGGERALEFTLMGSLRNVGDDQCYVLHHASNNQIAQVVRIGRNGVTTALRNETSCQ